jgi:hypothetical protein
MDAISTLGTVVAFKKLLPFAKSKTSLYTLTMRMSEGHFSSSMVLRAVRVADPESQ